VNFENLLSDAIGDRKLVRAIAYVITTEAGDEKAFFGALTKIGIETKTKDLQIFSSGSKKADWDVGLAVDAIKLAPKLDAIILVSGDGDFVPLVEYLKNYCQVEAVTFGKSASGKLKEVVDDFLDLDNDPKRYVIGKVRDWREENKDYPKRDNRNNNKPEIKKEPNPPSLLRKVIRRAQSDE
jgi:uncharacterized LabA/DUF88 family protein